MCGIDEQADSLQLSVIMARWVTKEKTSLNECEATRRACVDPAGSLQPLSTKRKSCVTVTRKTRVDGLACVRTDGVTVAPRFPLPIVFGNAE